MREIQESQGKVEFALDNRQVFFLFFGLSVVGCFVFALGGRGGGGGRGRGGLLRLGLCGSGGEQGGHPESIQFCHHLGLDYVSCSSPRVPIARLAAAHAKLGERTYTSD